MSEAARAQFKDRAEMGSDKWLGLVRDHLRRRIAEADERIGDARFSLCEIMTEPPAHLRASGGVLAWRARLEGRELTVEHGVDEGADVVVRGPYHDVLQFGRAFFGADDGGRKRRVREAAHRTRGRVTSEARRPAAGAAAFVFAALHDFLVPRTVENPDLAERLSAFGLGQAVRDLDAQGFAILEGAVTRTFADELTAAIIAASEEAASPSPGMLLRRGPIFEETALHPHLYSLAEHLCGKGMLLGQLLGLRKRKGPGEIGLHTDYVNVREPFPAQPQMCTAIWALKDFTAAAGSTWVVPGSHREKRHARSSDDLTKAIPLEMPKGSIAIWDGALWHWQGGRTDEGDRVTLHSTYMQSTMRPYDDYLRIDGSILARNPPELATLAAQDDIFGKNTAAGQQREYFARSLEVRRELA